jgi:hypothetical protein
MARLLAALLAVRLLAPGPAAAEFVQLAAGPETPSYQTGRLDLARSWRRRHRSGCTLDHDHRDCDAATTSSSSAAAPSSYSSSGTACVGYRCAVLAGVCAGLLAAIFVPLYAVRRY